jgi:4-amino-4-deoxychorismate lyase
VPARWRVRIAEPRLRANDPWLAVKSTQRGLYDQMRATLPDGVDEWLFLNERDELAEGTITTVFVQMPDGRKLTPARACGVLPGVLRAQMLGQGWREAILSRADLSAAQAVYMGNALRGLIAVDMDE